ncbi:putative mitochondrial protein atp12 precursor [Podospora fimiseda]|uniref:Mitochondrial protein atp12 n=1 Tax=Podospora fimiseda TaxID=252190 RepID=A0AAN7BUR5_9PEZI|nr:putative mitochondrial protein atp12 precursor [Podospora fimiseda]
MAASTRICLAAARRTTTITTTPVLLRFSYATTTTTTIRSIHISPPQSASVAPGLISSAPPPPPQPHGSLIRPSRRKRQIELLRNSNGTPQTRRRFWQQVSFEPCAPNPNYYEIKLDKRLVRHPTTKQPILIPISKPMLAHALAVEWDSLVSTLEATKTHLIPLTSLVCRAIDLESSSSPGSEEIKQGIVKMLLRYLDTDTILCMAPPADPKDPNSPYSYKNSEGKTLREVQQEKFDEVVGPLMADLWPGIKITPVLGDDGNSIFPKKQEEGARAVVQGYLLGLSGWELAGVERATLAGKSLLTAVRLIEEWKEGGRHGGKKKFGVEEAAKAVSVETDWQQARWGEVEDTHDVEREDVKRQFGSVVLLVAGKGN